jgi:malonate-semialdehyde dehydrogenase (acetylating)/methylmalonate-semialdehyde dehydrogenase
MSKIAQNYIDGRWCDSVSTDLLDVVDPGTGNALGKVPLSTAEDVDRAAQAAVAAQPAWRNTPPSERIQYLFKLKDLLETSLEDLARTISMECGKTLPESRGELRRAIENVEVACGIPALLQSEFSEDIARGIDEYMIRQPVGVAACIAPFNFPGMIPFWFLPYAVACGNTYIVKPSEKVPFTMQKVFELVEQIDLPKGVVNLVNGAKTAVDSLLQHPGINAISFVGSTAVARYIYNHGAANGKRVQAQGGAKNPVICLPDADVEMSAQIIADSVYGCAGQRCLASATVITVGEAKKIFQEALYAAAETKVTGYGLDEKVHMGPVITPESKVRITSLVQKSIDEGSNVLLDGRTANVPGYEQGNFIRPTILSDVNPAGEVFKTEIFGPVMGLMHVDSVDAAIELVNGGAYGNAASIFTGSGAAARKFRHQVQSGNIGINIGIAAPMAFFPFSGWKESFFGDLHGQGRHAVEFFTQTKVVIERWPKEWSRKF